MKNIGVLWDAEIDMEGDRPFDKEAWNREYKVFSQVAEDHGIRFCLANYSEYSDGGLEEAYILADGEWIKTEETDIDGVFDKFEFNEDTFELKKEIEDQVGILNRPALERLCKDKLETARKFSRVAETRKATQDNIRDVLSDGKAVVKPRYDFGGRGVQIIDSMDELEPVDSEGHVVQRFIDSSTGVPDTEYEGVHDLRAYVVNGEITFGLLRTPEEGLVSNVGQGGSQQLFPKEELRQDALQVIENVKEELAKFSPSMYSVDMIYDTDGNPWIVELNSKPGLSYYGDTEMKDKSVKTVEKLSEALKQL